ncbi:hypothetical protein BDZ45DRAFT_97554 [Acephala macrosclerotiorum]|nr:hypothetical protein BDZ45DRAFT_97554 [Acephala macrosclerotiorum]
MASASYTGIGIHLRLDSVLTSRPWGLQPLYPGHRIDSSSVTLRTPQVDTLPSFTRILNILLRNTQPKNNDDRKTFITNIAILHEVAFSPKCPILGTGHHFAVFASPFDADDRGFVPLDGRAVNPEVYCLKSPNFTSGGGTDSPPSKVAFRTEYYNTTLRELRVLLCPQLRRCENIISLFGLDFQEDYDDYTVAWPVLLMEYAEYGTLDTLQQDVTIDLDLARILLLDVAKGIQALHQCNIIHGDIKSENVLICRHNQRKYIARLGDFGLSLINPDPEKNDHRLPGGTFFWSAPEVGSALSVQGLRQTDIYSFGLAAWRVFINHPNPFELISPAALGTPISRSLTKAVTRAKSQNGFDQLVLQTMKRCGSHIYSHQVIEATLTKDPTGRSLDAVISALSRGREVALPNSEASEMYWATEEPALVLEQLDELCDERLPQLAMKPSVLHSLAREFESIFSSNSALAMQTGWFLFKFASSPSFQLLNKNIDECCRVLVRLCHLGFPLARAIVFRYHQLYSKDFQLLDREWLEEAAMDGSYYALKSLRMHYPEEHQKLMRSRLSIEPALDDFEKEDSLLKLCRQGDYDGCREMLRAGASAFPIEEGMVSPLHWLVSFNDENQISDLLNLLLQNGAVIDAYEGQIQDATFGRVKGTPLHWAVWYRNIPVLRALIRVSDQPTLEHLNRAIFIAAGMHFYDVLEILRDWIRSLKDGTHARCDWSIALICAAYNGIWQLPRSLRHGTKKLSMAFEKTMDIVVASRKPPEKDIRTLFQLSRAENNGLLLRYLFSRLNLAKRIDILNDPYCDIATASVGMGFRDIFELGIQNGIIGPQTEHGSQRFKALQICCSSRQRDPYFAGRLLDIGCAVDGRSTYTDGTWTPFAIAVALGLYHIAILLLERGADKDYLLGWLGGSTVTMNLLQSWPDIPVSRLKFLLEEVPRLGFGHVAFWSWPGAGGNLLYALSLSHWSSYAAGFRLGETAKYILSQLADKSCLNRIDKIGATALRMACASGNLEICQALIEAGQDVNLALGFSPLGNAKDWLKKCRKREKAAMANNNCLGGERRLAQALRIRAEQTVKLMEKHRAMDRGFFESIQNTTEYVSSGQWQMPSYEVSTILFRATFVF